MYSWCLVRHACPLNAQCCDVPVGVLQHAEKTRSLHGVRIRVIGSFGVALRNVDRCAEMMPSLVVLSSEGNGKTRSWSEKYHFRHW